MSDEDLKAELERLRSENAALKKGASGGMRMKVSEKGPCQSTEWAGFRDSVQGTMASTSRYVRRNTVIHRGKPSKIEKGLTVGTQARMLSSSETEIIRRLCERL
jgi:hypothetical protein